MLVSSSPLREEKFRNLTSRVNFQVKIVEISQNAGVKSTEAENIRGVEEVGIFVIEFGSQFLGLGWGAYNHFLKFLEALSIIGEQPIDKNFLFLLTL